MRAAIIALLIAAQSLVAQVPQQMSLAKMVALTSSSSAASGDPDPTTIPGLAYYWNSADLPSSGAVSNWTDRIQGLQWTNGNSALYAAGSASGVVFNGTSSKLTNTMNFGTLPGNFKTAFIVVSVQRITNPFDGFFTDIPGNGNQGVDFGVGTVEVPNTGTTLWSQPANVFQDWVMPVGVLSTGAKVYTNNVASKTLSTQIFGGTVGFALGATQGGGAPGKFTTSVIAIYTNNAIDISTNPIYRTALHLWSTNDSPSKPFAP